MIDNIIYFVRGMDFVATLTRLMSRREDMRRSLAKGIMIIMVVMMLWEMREGWKRRWMMCEGGRYRCNSCCSSIGSLFPDPLELNGIS